MATPTKKWRVAAVHNVNPDGVPRQGEKPVAAAGAGCVRVVCLADTHGGTRHRKLAVPAGDVLVHAGDFSMTGVGKDVHEFAQWFQSLPHPHKIVIAGNHDITFDAKYYRKTGAKRFHGSAREDVATVKALLTAAPGVTYLEDSATVLQPWGLSIYGSPWQPEFNDWAFNRERGADIAQEWVKIPDSADVVVTHGPPRGHGDALKGGGTAGCDDLLAAILRVRPALHVFGHIHEAYGTSSAGGTTFVNASNVDYHYSIANTPVVVDLTAS
eukprot:TRINITY_DN2729_c0_g1_i1.p1 TRINITY_DN2729_c0_g1~~TRINITY_DN2729_c0_g1_i1.p1  ORF type:complete len:270 (-),score=77.60 TRINITY_DN2729_c0_g1_i1:48-857(-)